MQYLGTNFTNGEIPDRGECTIGFDNAGFVMGTSSSLFNQFILQINDANGPAKDVPSVLKDAVSKVLDKLGSANNDIAEYTPNPFFGYHNSTSRNAQSETLTLVDGGEDLQNIPLHPLIQPKRNVDVIFAVDSSADTEFNWPNGASLIATYQRHQNDTGGSIGNGTAFPSVPDNNTFVNLGLNTKPTFFGCNSSNSTGPTPLIVYLPNAPLVYNSNVSTFNPAYNNTERNAIILNGYNVATRGNGSEDSAWSVCVGCAILSRSLERTNTNVPQACQECFTKYCWDGRLNTTTPGRYEPSTAISAVKVDEKSGATPSWYVNSLLLGAIAVGVSAMMI